MLDNGLTEVASVNKAWPPTPYRLFSIKADPYGDGFSDDDGTRLTFYFPANPAVIAPGYEPIDYNAKEAAEELLTKLRGLSGLEMTLPSGVVPEGRGGYSLSFTTPNTFPDALAEQLEASYGQPVAFFAAGQPAYAGTTLRPWLYAQPAYTGTITEYLQLSADMQEVATRLADPTNFPRVAGISTSNITRENVFNQQQLDALLEKGHRVKVQNHGPYQSRLLVDDMEYGVLRNDMKYRHIYFDASVPLTTTPIAPTTAIPADSNEREDDSKEFKVLAERIQAYAGKNKVLEKAELADLLKDRNVVALAGNNIAQLSISDSPHAGSDSIAFFSLNGAALFLPLAKLGITLEADILKKEDGTAPRSVVYSLNHTTKAFDR